MGNRLAENRTASDNNSVLAFDRNAIVVENSKNGCGRTGWKVRIAKCILSKTESSYTVDILFDAYSFKGCTLIDMMGNRVLQQNTMYKRIIV
ncbi:hypothetical protein D3C79_915980 [compost metagenome]